jgi:2',3'-cyclic-nucleotide 2'-phosphodiesterase (5'-nucleotidase family)
LGGVDYISSYLKILRQEYGKILLLDSGDIFSTQDNESSFTQDFYSILGYDAFTLGLRDFNQKLPSKYKSLEPYLKDFAATSKAPLVLSNLYDLKSAQVVDWTGTLPYLIKEINGVKIGIMGILPDDIVTQTPVDNRVGLYVENMLQSTLRNARLLRYCRGRCRTPCRSNAPIA